MTRRRRRSQQRKKETKEKKHSFKTIWIHDFTNVMWEKKKSNLLFLIFSHSLFFFGLIRNNNVVIGSCSMLSGSSLFFSICFCKWILQSLIMPKQINFSQSQQNVVNQCYWQCNQHPKYHSAKKKKKKSP